MHRNRLVWFAVGVVIVASIFLITIYISDSLHQRTLYVNRAVKGPSEEQALMAAETIDYAAITSLERFYGTSEANAYRRSGTYIYTWANFIDSEVIDYYQNRYDYQQKQKDPKGITFTYNANVTYLEQLRIFNITQPEQNTYYGLPETIDYPRTITWNNITTVFYGSDETIPLKTTGRMSENTFYKNQTTFCEMPPEFDLTFNNCYLVEMDLTYEEYYAPIAAFFVNTQQIVVLDQNFEPLWLSINPPLYAVA